MQAGGALLDFCTEYGAMLITFCRLLWKKMVFIRDLIFSMILLIIKQLKLSKVAEWRVVNGEWLVVKLKRELAIVNRE